MFDVTFVRLYLTGKALQGKEEVPSQESKAGRGSGLKNPFIKIHTRNAFAVQVVKHYDDKATE